MSTTLWVGNENPSSYNNDHKKSVTITDMIDVGGKPCWIVNTGQAYTNAMEAHAAFKKAIREAYKGHPPLGE